MTSDPGSYEHLREEIAALGSALDASARTLKWVTSEHSVAVARDAEGRLEVFITGEPLVATARVVALVLEHQRWVTTSDAPLPANRVVLPPGEHFDHFGALLCVELVDHGVHDDAQGAFAAVEPLIALALSRDVVSDHVVTGLVGELSLLEGLLSAAHPGARSDVLRSWAGSAPSARDFQFGGVGVEVKTTQGPSSVHQVEGVHQVEPGHANAGAGETALFMLSLGISWVSDPRLGRSLPDLVEVVAGLAPDPGARDDFLARVKQYGGDAAVGYDHDRDRGKSRYATRFYFRFERLYDLADERLELLSTKILGALSNIDADSVSFRVVLGEQVRGVHNPVTGWPSLLTHLMRAAAIPVLPPRPR